jgi:hypothetical protein
MSGQADVVTMVLGLMLGLSFVPPLLNNMYLFYFLEKGKAIPVTDCEGL